jgi:hypothetical protein
LFVLAFKLLKELLTQVLVPRVLVFQLLFISLQDVKLLAELVICLLLLCYFKLELIFLFLQLVNHLLHAYKLFVFVELKLRNLFVLEFHLVGEVFCDTCLLDYKVVF